MLSELQSNILRISVVDPFNFDMDPDPFREIEDPKNRRNFKLFSLFFSIENLILKNIIFFCYL